MFFNGFLYTLAEFASEIEIWSNPINFLQTVLVPPHFLKEQIQTFICISLEPY